jgi:iron-sulfur cluster assembly protein
MALDEPKESDTIFTEQGITFTIDRDLLEKAKPIQLDFVEACGQAGFQLTSSLSEEGGEDGCCS